MQARAVINGGFFFLEDEGGESPLEIAYGTIIRGHAVYGLQAHDRSFLYASEAGLEAREVAAQGVIEINGIKLLWKGAYSRTIANTPITLYNSSCCNIRHIQDAITGSRRVFDAARSITPANSGVYDIVCERQGDQLIVSKVSPGGATNVLSGNFILQAPQAVASFVREGQTVIPKALDTIDLASVRSAITIGPSLEHFVVTDEHDIHEDRSLGDNAPFLGRRMAHSVIGKTREGEIFFEVFDGAPKTTLFKGVTPLEVFRLVKSSYQDIEWAYHLDPGQSARMEVRFQDATIKGYGNTHYIRWPNDSSQPFLWAGTHGRPVPSAIVAFD